MPINPTSKKILNDSVTKLKSDKELLIKSLSDVINKIDALQLTRKEIQKQIDDCDSSINDIQVDIE